MPTDLKDAALRPLSKRFSEEALADWRFRCIVATDGNRSRLGTMFLSMLGRPVKSPPWFGPSCVITEGGWVLANFVDRHNALHPAQRVGSVEDIRASLNGLADHILATDEEREAIFALFRQWVSKDFRTDKDALDRVNPTFN